MTNILNTLGEKMYSIYKQIGISDWAIKNKAEHKQKFLK